MSTSPRRYDLLAIDLDGTFLGPRGEVSAANLAAVHRARAAGMRVVVCTGRGLVECKHITAMIEQTDPVVVAGGAIIACPVTKATLHRFGMGREVVSHAVGVVLESNHAALVLKDPLAAGYDYLIVRGERNIQLDPVTTWWFKHMNVRTREIRHLDEDEHPEHTVRVGACGRSTLMAGVKAKLHERYADEVLIHHFHAVVAPDSVSKDGDELLHVLEAFDKHANKWSAISRLARQWGIEQSRIAAVGDEINDVGMIKNAGLGIAMGNAIPQVREVAKVSTKRNTEDGVAHAVEQILSGVW